MEAFANFLPRLLDFTVFILIYFLNLIYVWL